MEITVGMVEGRIQESFREFVQGKCVKTLKSTCPADTGAMRDEIHAEQISNDRYWVGTNKWYAKFTEYGRKAVVPVRKKALYWPDIIGGHPVSYAKEAKDPRYLHWVEKAVAKLS